MDGIGGTIPEDRSAPRGRALPLAIFGFGVSLLAIALVAVLVYRENRAAAETNRWALHTLTVLGTVGELETALGIFEAKHGGFLISGDQRYLIERDQLAQRARDLLEVLQEQTLRSTARAQLSDARRLLARRFDMAEHETHVAQAQGLEAARVVFLAGDAFQPVLQALAALRSTEEDLLSQRARAALEQSIALKRTLLFGGLTAFVMLLAAAVVVLRQLGKLTAAERANRQLTCTLQAQALQLQGTNRELESFSYSVSHDLRAPLRHIHGYAQMLEEDAGPMLEGEPRRYLAAIRQSARQMGVLIDDLLALSRLGRKRMRIEPIDMNALVSLTLAELDGAERVQVEPLPVCQGDVALLKQVWTNLLSNAIKYSAPRGDAAQIIVSGRREVTGLRYQVTDNGVGFDPRYADKLFSVFQRLHSGAEFEGTGVGLAIVQRIVSRHGGSVDASGRPGEGATFGFVLPHEPQREEAEQ